MEKLVTAGLRFAVMSFVHPDWVHHVARALSNSSSVPAQFIDLRAEALLTAGERITCHAKGVAILDTELAVRAHRMWPTELRHGLSVYAALDATTDDGALTRLAPASGWDRVLSIEPPGYDVTLSVPVIPIIVSDADVQLPVLSAAPCGYFLSLPRFRAASPVVVVRAP